ncbi:MAG TPA: hypothetical protein VIF64_07465 [Pyrinomonadaceae bacterium]
MFPQLEFFRAPQLERSVRRLLIYATANSPIAYPFHIGVDGLFVFHSVRCSKRLRLPDWVHYKVNRDPKKVLSFTETPAKIASAQISTRDKAQWRALAPEEYKTSHTDETFTVTVDVGPHEAVWVTSMFHYFGDEDPNDVASWPIDEIGIAGVDGSMTFTGQKTRKAFTYVSRVLYTLTYK